jgi:hypothetical protein
MPAGHVCRTGADRSKQSARRSRLGERIAPLADPGGKGFA